MPWEMRGTAGPYFYRHRKIDGRVFKVYHGRGQKGKEAECRYQATRVELTRLRQEADRQRREEDRCIAAVAEPLLSFDGAVTISHREG